MRDYITETYEAYERCALQFDEEKFANDVLKSFMDAKTYHHYVLLITCDLNEYYTTEEHHTFEKNGYYQQPVQDRFDNRFFIPDKTMKQAVDQLKKEKMFVQETKVNNVSTYVVTVNGIHDSYFSQDFATPAK